MEALLFQTDSSEELQSNNRINIIYKVNYVV